MLRRSKLLFILVISSMIIQTFAALMWELEQNAESIEAVRNDRKQRSFTRGVALSFSLEIKQKFCADLFHAQLYKAGEDSSSSEEDEESEEPQPVEETVPKVEELSTLEKAEGDVSKKNVEEADKKVTSQTSGTAGASHEVTEKTDDVDKKIEPGKEVSAEITYREIKITDYPTNEGIPQHPLVVKEVTIGDNAPLGPDLFFTCSILNAETNQLDENLYLISTAFLPGWFYVSILNTDEEDQKESPDQANLSKDQASLRSYFARSPWLERLYQDKLEDRYAAIRENLEIISKESPDYFNLILEKNDITALSIHERKLLCVSLLSSPVYQVERLEAQKTFNNDSGENEMFGDIIEVPVAFHDSVDRDYKAYKAKCIQCTGFKDFDEDPAENTQLLITPSFNDLDSLIVLKEENEGDKRWFLNKYFEKVSILTNAREHVTQTDVVTL